MNRTTVAILASLAAAIALSQPPASAGTIKGKIVCKGMRNNGDAVVYIESVDGKFAPPAKPVEMDQIKMKFVPHVLPVVVGTTVRFLNSDPVLHNIFTPSKAGDRFNLGSWPQGQTKDYTFTKLGEVRLLCNVHPEMLAWVLILQNPYFAKTAADGTYSISNVPAGNYSLKAWHEKLKPASQAVTVPASGEVNVNLTVSR